MQRNAQDSAPTEDIQIPLETKRRFVIAAPTVEVGDLPEHSKSSSPPQSPSAEVPRENRIREIPESDDDEYREWQKNMKAVERKILGSPAFKDKLYLLERIEAKGASRVRLARILALIVSEDSLESVFHLMAKKRDELKQLSGALEKVAQQTERVLSDPFCYSDSWFTLLLDSSSRFPDSDKYKFSLPENMKRYARAAKAEARKIGIVMRLSRRSRRRKGIVALLGYVQTATNTSFDAELVQLLMIAGDAVGVRRRYTVGQMRKIRERHVKPYLDK